MARSFVYIVSENPEVIEKIKKSHEAEDVSYYTYSGHQWREGLDNPFFRSQLVNGVPALSTGLNPLTAESTPHMGNVVSFPNQSENKVQKMDDLEAKAIESAITQFKGNLTEAAKALGIGRATLYRKVKQYHIDPSQARRRKVAA
ncbi:MAG: hypothetical protein A2622_10085 [Bdellovibrionales bacterium RIFCSPHIGHO2_01_FULL_40_29]|nr:MAG: hypothetical protein A2622_10085 [Bdellovibrionales bacterium RIFCSPHIGHO2_01_FULL_40_29]OFZ32405.1 MAG: hypothetical protein A3D17_12575 [Bdellovibrionales bacterium RIFCSPHIGHO2_02_FULL_40_15]